MRGPDRTAAADAGMGPCTGPECIQQPHTCTTKNSEAKKNPMPTMNGGQEMLSEMDVKEGQRNQQVGEERGGDERNDVRAGLRRACPPNSSLSGQMESWDTQPSGLASLMATTWTI